MTLVHVETRDVLVARYPQHAHAADAEDDLLAEPIPGVAPVEGVGQRAVPGGVARQVGVKQQHGHLVAADAPDQILPRPQVHRPSLEGDLRAARQLAAELCNWPILRTLGLPSVRVEVLREVTLPMEQGDRHHSHLEIGGGAGAQRREVRLKAVELEVAYTFPGKRMFAHDFASGTKTGCARSAVRSGGWRWGRHGAARIETGRRRPLTGDCFRPAHP